MQNSAMILAAYHKLMNFQPAPDSTSRRTSPSVSLRRIIFLCAIAIGLVLPTAANATAQKNELRLWGNALKDGNTMPNAQVFNDWGFKGENISPHLAWSGAPEGTKSFVVTVYDPDAPTGSGFWHWVVINIPANVTELPRGCGSGISALPEGALQTRTDMGKPGYMGAAPPAGLVHHYIFTVYALKIEKLEVTADTSAAMVGFMVHQNALAHASLTVTYGH